jgi:hypothetical protein
LVKSSSINAQVLIGFYRVLYFLARVWTLKGKDKQLEQPELITCLINEPFFDKTL